MLSKILSFAAVIAGLSIAASTEVAAQNDFRFVHLDVATQGLTTQAPLFIAQEKGYFAQERLEVAFQFIGGGTVNLQALAIKQADIATGSPSPALWNAVARDIPIKVTAAISSLSPDPATGFTSAMWLVLPSGTPAKGPIKTYADLKGRTIGVLGRGLGAEILVDAALQKGGLTLKDAELKEVRGADVYVAFTNGAVDAATEIEPFVTLGVDKGLLVRWKNAAELTPGRVAAVMMFGPRLSDRTDDVGARFMTAWTRAARDYNDAFGPKHRDEDRIVKILTTYTDVKDPALYPRMTWHYVDPNCTTAADVLKLDLEWDVEHGYVQKKPNLGAAIDDRYCQAALKKLGRYPAH